MRFALLLAAVGLFAQDPTPVYKQMCAGCHGDNASGTDRGPGLLNARSLRRRSEAQIRTLIRNGTQGGMPAFPIADGDLDTLARVIRSWNASVFEAKPTGDTAAGKRYFGANCEGCHMVHGVGGSNGPDLSEIAKELTLSELTQTLDDPNSRRGKRNSSSCPGWAFCPDDPYAVVTVKKKDGASLRGFARARGAHDLQLQSLDGKFHLLQESEWASVVEEKRSLMPALNATASERRDLIAYLATLGGIPLGPITAAPAAPTPQQVEAIIKPKQGEWPGYHGSPSANRHSPLAQINTANAAKLKPAWSYALPHMSLQTTPLVADGVMYVTAPNQVCALDSTTGREIWCYVRTRGDARKISGDAAKGAQRGAAMLGDRDRKSVV